MAARFTLARGKIKNGIVIHVLKREIYKMIIYKDNAKENTIQYYAPDQHPLLRQRVIARIIDSPLVVIFACVVAVIVVQGV